MKPFRFRLRTLLIAVAALSVPLAAVCYFVRTVSERMTGMYGPDGLLARKQRYYEELQLGDADLTKTSWSSAEGHFRAALHLAQTAKYQTFKDPVGDESTPSIGLADALSGQGRSREAVEFYDRAANLDLAQMDANKSLRYMRKQAIKTLERQATALRKLGYSERATAVETQLASLREDSPAP